ncbi:MAG: hypothetical protein R2733_23285 [Acidimicrobiales bacterium]
MFRKLLVWGVRRSFAGPGKPWLVSSGAFMAMRMFKSVSTKAEVIDLSNSKPGDKIVIEHLDITHAQQIKQIKAAKKAEKRAAKDAKRLARKG